MHVKMTIKNKINGSAIRILQKKNICPYVHFIINKGRK